MLLTPYTHACAAVPGGPPVAEEEPEVQPHARGGGRWAMDIGGAESMKRGDIISLSDSYLRYMGCTYLKPNSSTSKMSVELGGMTGG